MSFDVDKLFECCVSKIDEFAVNHQNETFYAFAIDEGLLCLNSVEKFGETLKKYQEDWDRKARQIKSWEDMTDKDHRDSSHLLGLAQRYKGLDLEDKEACLKVINEERQVTREENPTNPYLTEENINDIRTNTGDWVYQGFAEMNVENGFDLEAYYMHYDLDDEEQLNSEYGLAMDSLVVKLRKSGAFKRLKLANDFYATRVEHNY